MKKDTLIQVTWNDIVEDAGWTEEKDITDAPYKAVSLGYFLKKTDQQLFMSCTRATDGKTRNYTKIPLGCITEIRLLHLGGKCRE